MPEGDTIHKICNYLAPRLAGEAIEDVEIASDPAATRCKGRTIETVDARGKHLFFHLDNALSIRSHLGMYGSWHRYAPGETWQKPPHRASLRLRVSGHDYVCFNAKEVELIDAPSVRNAIVRSRLGPDLIADDPETSHLVRRARDIMRPDDLIGDVLLDQRVASGIGNVYKSEVLFIERLSPMLTLHDVSDEQLACCFEVAADRLGKNLGGGKRVTRFENDKAGRLWVYGRRGKPCIQCETPVRSQRMGRHHRGTYWCPACQSK
jgi:endonuclease-8